MLVDVRVRRALGYTVAFITYRGKYTGQDVLRKEFDELLEWAKNKKLRVGKWIFSELSQEHWEACLEIKGNARSGGKVRIKKLPEQLVAAVKFNPDQVSARLVYYGIEGWLTWRKKEREYESAGKPREVYAGSPWKSPKAWANTEVQYPIRRLGRR
jgi:hypothetical protein